MAGFDQTFHALVDVADEHHGCAGVDGLTPPTERPTGHVVLHDLHAIVVLEVDASHLVKRHHVPQSHQPDLARAHVVEQVGHRRLPT